jgi:hypothetical protein
MVNHDMNFCPDLYFFFIFFSASLPFRGPEKAACPRYGSFHSPSQQLVRNQFYEIFVLILKCVDSMHTSEIVKLLGGENILMETIFP